MTKQLSGLDFKSFIPNSFVNPVLLSILRHSLGWPTSKSGRVSAIPYRFRHLGGTINTLLGVSLRRGILKKCLKRYSDNNGISVVIGLRGRVNYRLTNCLISLRSQTYPQESIKIIIVDYGNERETRKQLELLSQSFDCIHVKVDNIVEWNRSHCLNIGIKTARTPFVMLADADMIFAPNYLDVVISQLKFNPLGYIVSSMLDLPEGAQPILENCAVEQTAPDLIALKAISRNRFTLPYHVSLHAASLPLYYLINGYDEYYRLYGAEDEDLYLRFRLLGLNTISISSESFYLHQWHPKHQGVKSKNLSEVIENNLNHFKRNHSLVRNNNGWGLKP